MSLRQEFRRSHPDFPLLEASRPDEVGALLADLGWLDQGETVVGCARAGEGNMNLTLRVSTGRRRFILKQSRPWVEKYDEIAAPFDRALVEQRFYERVATIPEVASAMPRLLRSDATSRTLMLEDLAPARDLTYLYAEGELLGPQAAALGNYLRHLHGATRGERDLAFANREMRALNHRHLFEVPLDPDSGLDLDALERGLAARAAQLRADSYFCKAVAELGRRYLADGPCLVHGDFFPGSWLETADGLRVIDPEFCHLGDPELDLGVAVAHLVLSRQWFGLDQELISAAVDPDPEVVVEEALVAAYAGVEVMRRLIGVAQLPIPPTDGFRANMLDRARVAVREETLEAFRT